MDIKNFMIKRRVFILSIAVTVVTALLLLAAYVFAVSPAAIRSPKLEHAHLRMQLVTNGQAVNFGDDKYQETYEKGVCSDGLTEAPIHFHDNTNNFVHVHWKDMTGGLVLKNYGWDYVGGPDNLLGYRIDELPRVKSVPIYGNVLPEQPNLDNIWVYTGSAGNHKQRTAKEFIDQDLETFFGVKSRINAEEELSFWDTLFPKVMAHGGEHEEGASHEDLQRINNLLGDVVIFVQEEKPTGEQIKDQFNNLAPLTESTCGG